MCEISQKLAKNPLISGTNFRLWCDEAVTCNKDFVMLGANFVPQLYKLFAYSKESPY